MRAMFVNGFCTRMIFLPIQLLLLHTTQMYAALSGWNEDGSISEFSVVNKGRMYHHTVLMFLERINAEECVYYCLSHLQCVTVSYSDVLKQCELNGMEFDETEADTEAKDWTNYGAPPKVDGQYSEWVAQTSCSNSCNGGTIIYQRFCNNPPPKNNGKDCEGEYVKTGTCNNDPCPGTWGAWGEFTTCSTTCGDGEKTRKRICTSPAGKADCDTSTAGIQKSFETEIQSCNNVPCIAPCVVEDNTVYSTDIIDNHFLTSSWMECSQKCFLNSECEAWTWNTMQFPLTHNQKECRLRKNLVNMTKIEKVGKMSGMKSCGSSGTWGAWGEFTTCSTTCGDGEKTRKRICTSPAGKADCDTSTAGIQKSFETEIQSCNNVPCIAPCVVEDNTVYSTDIIDNHFLTSSWMECSQKCFLNSECEAWTWNTMQFPLTHNQKECRLRKNLVNMTKIEKVGKMSGMKSCGSSDYCTIEMKVFFVDDNTLIEDAALPVASNHTMCSQNCLMKDKCKSWSFHQSKCHIFKTQLSSINAMNKKKDAYAVSGTRACALNHPCKIEVGISYIGNDVSYKTTENIRDCSLECLSLDSCVIWEWNKSKECVLKLLRRANGELSEAKVTGTKECAKYLS